VTKASRLDEVDARLRPMLSREVIADVVASVPEAWLDAGETDAHRAAYVDYLTARAGHSRMFVEEASRARLPRV
jgi:hypothetical protein